MYTKCIFDIFIKNPLPANPYSIITVLGLTWSIFARLGPTKQTLVIVIGRSLHVVLGSQSVALGVQPAITLQALDDHLVFMVLVATHRTVNLAATGPALGVVVLPVTAEPRGGGTTIHAHYTPVLDHKCKAEK